ncbi:MULTISPECIES: helicase RepA family protein [unclassified Roseovarius]|uniref:AAA family ATPase n=1 Tax=unclassified Roseovarius TaxID=2614913 RepID=UPI00273F6C4B|nr:MULTISPECIES: helicase RepA family protein [unclassified Roseovarius]
MTSFDGLHAQDTAHLKEVGSAPVYIAPELPKRASALRRALEPISSIRPVIKSRYLVKGWIDRETVSVVYGESNVGKTFFALDLAMHVAAGRPWHGHLIGGVNEGSNGPVLYIAGEGGYGINNRIEAIRLDQPELIQSIEGNGEFLLLPTALDLCAKGDATALVSALERLDDIPLIVIDTLARSMGTGDENTAKDMGAFVRNIDFIRAQTGAHIMVIHHSGKDTSKGARGSGSLRAAVDTEIELTRSGNVIMAETRKQRDMPTGQVFAYTLRGVEIGIDEDGDKVTSAVVEQTDPVAKTIKITGQQKIALQALDDALAHHGTKQHGDMFPDNRNCVSTDIWKEFCTRHALSDGESDSARRKAFFSAKKGLQEKEVIRIVDDYVWRCGA